MLRRCAQRAAQLASASQRCSQRDALYASAAFICGPSQQAQTPLCKDDRHCFSTNSHDVFNVHKHASDNNWETDFDFTDANYEIAAEIIARYPSNYKASAVIPLLDLAQKQNDGWLSLNAMNREDTGQAVTCLQVAKVLEMPPIRVYEVATFYTMFNRSKMGQYHIMVCGTTPCMLQGARKIYAAIKERLGIDYGETTQDGKFTLGEMECMGSCVNAPMIAVADYTNGVEGFSYNYYEDLTPQDAVKVIDQLASGEQPRLGSQYRGKAEPAGAIIDGKWVPKADGQTTLNEQPPGPMCRDLTDPPKPPEQPAAKQ